jgi:hypothetical protein
MNAYILLSYQKQVTKYKRQKYRKIKNLKQKKTNKIKQSKFSMDESKNPTAPRICIMKDS